MNESIAFRSLAMLLLVAAAACDPCAGMSMCGDARISAEGEVVWHFDRSPAEGTVVRFERLDGVPLESDTITAHVDADGRFRLEALALQRGAVHGRLIILPPAPFEMMAYADNDITVLASPVRGDVRYLGSWGAGPVTSTLRITYVGELFSRGSGLPLVGAHVEVRRKAGVLVEPDPYATQSDADGRFFIDLRALQVGAVVADIRVRPPVPEDSFSVAEMVLTPSPNENHYRNLARWGVGEHVFYSGELQWTDTNERAGGIDVEFRRTGGMPMEPAVLRVRTGGDGRFHLRPSTIGSGTIVGDLIIWPGTPQARTIAQGMELVSFAQDNPRFLRVWWLER